MWTILKIFIEFVTILPLFYSLVFRLCGRWDFSFLTRDQTRTPCIGRENLNRCTTREVPLTGSRHFPSTACFHHSFIIVHLVCRPFASNLESLQAMLFFFGPWYWQTTFRLWQATGGPGHMHCFYGKSYLHWPSSHTDTRNTKTVYFLPPSLDHLLNDVDFVHWIVQQRLDRPQEYPIIPNSEGRFFEQTCHMTTEPKSWQAENIRPWRNLKEQICLKTYFSF